jgi:hypothetical protein
MMVCRFVKLVDFCEDLCFVKHDWNSYSISPFCSYCLNMLKSLNMNILEFKNTFTHDTRIQSCTYTHTQALTNVCMVVSCLDSSCAVLMFSRDRTALPQGQHHRFNETHTWSIGTWYGTFNILFHFTIPHTFLLIVSTSTVRFLLSRVASLYF